MQEIWIPEALITLFLFLYIIRPFVKKLIAIDGLAWLPLLALIVTIVLIPSYGFRPETLALLIYALILTVISIVKKAGNDSKFRDFRGKKFIFALPPLLILAAAAALAFFFSPQTPIHSIEEGYSQETVNAGDREYLIRIYTDETDLRPSERPLLLLLPPTPGSLDAIALVCGELSSRGFTVLTCAGRGPGTEWLDYLHAAFSGDVSEKANRKGRALEYKRREDFLFLLSWIRQNPRIGNSRLFDIASRNAVFFAGYDTGGSALILTGNSLPLTMTKRSTAAPGARPSPQEIRIRGIIAVESQLWSLYREEIPEIPPLPPEAGWFHSVRHGLNRWFLEMKPKKITRLERMPEIPIPLLLMGSGPHDSPLDYSDFPVKYPLITALLRGGRKQDWKNIEAPARTAEIIAAFAASVPKDPPPQNDDQNDVQGDYRSNVRDESPSID